MIPDPEITIAKIGEGLQAGNFLFTAETVDSLKAFYVPNAEFSQMKLVNFAMSAKFRTPDLVTNNQGVTN